MNHDSSLPGEFVVIEKSTMTPIEPRFHSPEFSAFHMLNAYESSENQIILDMSAAKNDVLDYFYFSVG